MHVYSFMSVSLVTSYLGLIRAIVACFVHLVRSNVHQSNKEIVAVTKTDLRQI